MNPTIRFPEEKDLCAENIDKLCNIINKVYTIGEDGLLKPGFQRINYQDLQTLLFNNEILLAIVNEEIIGCGYIKKFSSDIVKIGMLAVAPEYQCKGVGNKIMDAVQNYALKWGCSIIRLELLTPKDWLHPHKEMLKKWYVKIGFVPQFIENFEKEDILAVPCIFTVYDKIIK